MLAFEIQVNGKRKCVAGLGEPGVLSMILTWHLDEPKGRRTSTEDIALRAGGLVSRTYEHVDWGRRALRRGDEVVIRVVEVGEADPPKERWRDSPAKRRREQRTYVRRMAKQFGWKVETQ
jgi:hypothetical protein